MASQGAPIGTCMCGAQCLRKKEKRFAKHTIGQRTFQGNASNVTAVLEALEALEELSKSSASDGSRAAADKRRSWVASIGTALHHCLPRSLRAVVAGSRDG